MNTKLFKALLSIFFVVFMQFSMTAQISEKIEQENKAIDAYKQAIQLSKILILGQEEDFKKEIKKLSNN